MVPSLSEHRCMGLPPSCAGQCCGLGQVNSGSVEDSVSHPQGSPGAASPCRLYPRHLLPPCPHHNYSRSDSNPLVGFPLKISFPAYKSLASPVPLDETSWVRTEVTPSLTPDLCRAQSVQSPGQQVPGQSSLLQWARLIRILEVPPMPTGCARARDHAADGDLLGAGPVILMVHLEADCSLQVSAVHRRGPLGELQMGRVQG